MHACTDCEGSASQGGRQGTECGVRTAKLLLRRGPVGMQARANCGGAASEEQVAGVQEGAAAGVAPSPGGQQGEGRLLRAPGSARCPPLRP